jgi:beta-cyclopiazonate dehydrogenase
VWHYDFSGIPGKYTVKLMGDDKFSADDAKKMIADDLGRIRGEGTALIGKVPTIDAFASHSPLQLHPSPESLEAGFYKKLYSLQGHRNTFYTGHAWAGDYSSVLWQFTERILPSMI